MLFSLNKVASVNDYLDKFNKLAELVFFVAFYLYAYLSIIINEKRKFIAPTEKFVIAFR